jgi:hypothetical protein
MKTFYTNCARAAFRTMIALSIVAALTVPIRSTGQDVDEGAGGGSFEPRGSFWRPWDTSIWRLPDTNIYGSPGTSGSGQSAGRSSNETEGGKDDEARIQSRKNRAAWELRALAPNLSALPISWKMRTLGGL